MAGSFGHCDDNGRFRFDLIDNLGDAYEACQMMHWMIWWLAANGTRPFLSARSAVETAKMYYYEERKHMDYPE